MLDCLMSNHPKFRWENCEVGGTSHDFAALWRASVMSGIDVYDALSNGGCGRCIPAAFIPRSCWLPSGSRWCTTVDTRRIVLKGLDRNATYALSFQDRPEQNVTEGGTDLMDHGFDVTMTGRNAWEIVCLEPATADARAPTIRRCRVA